MRQELYYISKKHAPAHRNLFSPKTDPEAPGEFYDLAFYHKKLEMDEATSHHESKTLIINDKFPVRFKKALPELNASVNQAHPENLKTLMQDLFSEENWQEETIQSLFFLRCESSADQLLVGNMQRENMDDVDPNEIPALNKILGGKANVYKIMVQRAIQEALSTGKKKIYFQAGHAAEIAQWYDRSLFYYRELITPANFGFYQREHAARAKKLAEIKIGDEGPYLRIKRSQEISRGVVIKKTSTAAFTKLLGNGYILPYVMDNAPMFWGYRSGLQPAQIKKDLKKNITIDFEKLLLQQIKDGSARISLPNIAEMFNLDIEDANALMYGAKRFNEAWPGQNLTQLAQRSLYLDLKLAYQDCAPERALEIINRIFNYILPVDFADRKTEKSAALKKIFDEHKRVYTMERHTRADEVRLDDPGRFRGGGGQKRHHANKIIRALTALFIRI